MTNYEKLYNLALDTLKTDDTIFCDMVEELDSWNGYGDGFRCYDMEELDELFCGMKISEFLEKLCESFSYYDQYFYCSIYGIDSTDDKVDLYRCSVNEADMLDQIIKYNDDLWFCDDDFKALIEELANCKEEVA